MEMPKIKKINILEEFKLVGKNTPTIDASLHTFTESDGFESLNVACRVYPCSFFIGFFFFFFSWDLLEQNVPTVLFTLVLLQASHAQPRLGYEWSIIEEKLHNLRFKNPPNSLGRLEVETESMQTLDFF